jgi:hypothetical protein
MDGLVLPLLILAASCVVIALKLGALPAIRRGWGAMRIQKLLHLELPRSHYTILQDVRLASSKECLLVDHLLVSAYGIFVIKHLAGGGKISGKPGDAHWYRTTRRGTQRFQNPLFECVTQVNALRSMLGLDATLFQFVLVFSSQVTFSNPMPVNVTKLDGLPLFIEGRDQLLIDFDEIPKLVGQIRRAKPRSRWLGSNFQPAPR